MHKEDFERKRRDEFLKKIKHLYDGRDGTEPDLEAVVQQNNYTTKCAKKVYLLLTCEEIHIEKEISYKLDHLNITIKNEILYKVNDLFKNET